LTEEKKDLTIPEERDLTQEIRQVKDLELTPEERELILKETLTDEDIDRLSRLTLAVQGKPTSRSSVQDYLIDTTNLSERSRFPTYAILSQATYLDNISMIDPVGAKSCKTWSDNLKASLIGYKGLGRIEALDTKKSQAVGTTQEFNIGSQSSQIPESPMKKAHFWSRPKTQAPEQKGEFNE